jgi:hypothetical protein
MTKKVVGVFITFFSCAASAGDDGDDEDNRTNGQSHYARHRDEYRENGVSQDNRWELVDDGEPY